MRTTTKVKTAVERLAEFLDVSLNPTGGGRYAPDLPTVSEEPTTRRKLSTLAFLTLYAREQGIPPREVREAVRWRDPALPFYGKDVDRYKYELDKMIDKIGAADTRMLLEVYRA